MKQGLENHQNYGVSVYYAIKTTVCVVNETGTTKTAEAVWKQGCVYYYMQMQTRTQLFRCRSLTGDIIEVSELHLHVIPFHETAPADERLGEYDKLVATKSKSLDRNGLKVKRLQQRKICRTKTNVKRFLFKVEKTQRAL